MKGLKQISIPETAENADVDEDDVADVLMELCKQGWLDGHYVRWNERSEGNLELPEE